MVNHTSLELHLQVWDNVGKVVQYTFPIFHTRRSIMNTKLATAQIRVKNWAAIIQERNESGLSVKDYCAQHQLSWDSYYYWLRKVKEALLVESSFVEVTQPKQFPVQRSVTADPNEMLTLKFFCGSSNREIKGLVWEEDGFLLIYKRLEAGTFQWPRSEAEARNITSEQYHLLMSGYSIDPSVHKIDPKHPVWLLYKTEKFSVWFESLYGDKKFCFLSA